MPPETELLTRTVPAHPEITPDTRAALEGKALFNRGEALLFFGCCLVLVVSFRNTFCLMLTTWYHSRTFSHCFLVFPIFIFLVWSTRDRFRGLTPVPNLWGLLIVPTILLTWVLANLGEVKMVQEFCVVSLLPALVLALLGGAYVKAFAFPLVFTSFAVPFGTGLVKPLQDFTSWFVIHALTISNVPAVLENHTIFLPTGTWAVAEACSGIRFLLSAIVLGTVFSFLLYRSLVRRLLFLAVSIVVPLLGNGLRAYGIILFAHLTDNRLAAKVDHVVYGGIFAVFIQLLLIFAGLRWRETQDQKPAPANPGVLNGLRLTSGRPTTTAFFVAAVSVMMIVTPGIAARLWNRTPAAAYLSGPPVRISAPWDSISTMDMSWVPDWRNREREFTQSFQRGDSRVDLYWVMYSGRFPMDFVTKSDGTATTRSWAFAGDSFVNPEVEGRSVKVYASTIKSGMKCRAVWTWYIVGGQFTSDHARVRLLQAKARLSGKPASVMVINLASDNESGSSSAEGVLRDFLHHASFAKDVSLPNS